MTQEYLKTAPALAAIFGHAFQTEGRATWAKAARECKALGYTLRKYPREEYAEISLSGSTGFDATATTPGEAVFKARALARDHALRRPCLTGGPTRDSAAHVMIEIIAAMAGLAFAPASDEFGVSILGMYASQGAPLEYVEISLSVTPDAPESEFLFDLPDLSLAAMAEALLSGINGAIAYSLAAHDGPAPVGGHVTATPHEMGIIKECAQDAVREACGLGLAGIEAGVRYNVDKPGRGESVNIWLVSDDRAAWEDSDLSGHYAGTFKESLTDIPLTYDGRGEIDFYLYSREGLENNIQAEFDRAGLVAVKRHDGVIWSREHGFGPQGGPEGPENPDGGHTTRETDSGNSEPTPAPTRAIPGPVARAAMPQGPRMAPQAKPRAMSRATARAALARLAQTLDGVSIWPDEPTPAQSGAWPMFALADMARVIDDCPAWALGGDDSDAPAWAGA